jgi:hypothetical protein
MLHSKPIHKKVSSIFFILFSRKNIKNAARQIVSDNKHNRKKDGKVLVRTPNSAAVE